MRIGVQKYRPERDSRRGSADSGGQGSRWMMPPYAHLWERCNVAGALQDGVVTLHTSNHAPICHDYCWTCLLISNKDRCMSLLWLSLLGAFVFFVQFARCVRCGAVPNCSGFPFNVASCEALLRNGGIGIGIGIGSSEAGRKSTNHIMVTPP